ncbi:MAG: class I tRNA ligase family protein, partial [Actinomycetota bacterium]|nr:class I tRNA ligase family protein [Actinomycetota bacterium]
DDLEEYGKILVSDAVPTNEPTPAPFTAHWCVVKPGATSDRHMHRETEAYFVTRGRGVVTVDGEDAEVVEGDTIYLDPLLHHSIHNPADADEDLVFITVYWADDEARAKTDAALSESVRAHAPILAFATPATPNGDLHLGHLSGPYLAGDIWARSMRARGADARFVTGTDDHQTYVEHKARQLGKSVQETTALYMGRIREALQAADVDLDLFVRPAESDSHRQRTADFFARLYESGKLRREVVPTLFCTRCERHLFEVYVRGRCPHCNAGTSGNGCEQCGRPNECADLVDPICNICEQAPVRRSQERVVFPLEEYREQLQDFASRARMSTHLRTLCERMLTDPLPTISVTHESDWGIPVPVPGFEGQVIWSWLEVAALYLEVAADLSEEHGWTVGENGFLADSDVEVVQFFGFDNGYFKAMLLTALYLATDEEGKPPSTFVTNEFYRLDGRKFSTSSNHLVSVLDSVGSVPSDLLRYYLCYTRPELVETNFVKADFEATVQRDLVDGWQGWLHGLGAKLGVHFDGAVPDTGLWTEQHRLFESELRTWCARAEQHLSVQSFSPARLVRVLNELVRESSQFGAAEARWAEVHSGGDMFRTAMALELAAARTLAILAAPVTPRFSAALWEDLGESAPLEEHGWTALVRYPAPGTTVQLERAYFAL